MATSVQDFIKANPRYVGYANTSNRTVAAPRTPQPKKKGRGGFLSSIISELGGAGGAAGGAALGTLLLPGVGTVIGAGLGGFLGGTGGRGIENKVRDDQNFFGAGGSAKSAFGEGALSGVLSGAGGAFQAAKGAKAARGMASALGGADDAAKVAGTSMKNAGRVGMLEKKGVDVTSKAGGYYARDNMPGIGKVTTDKVKHYDDLLRKLKIGANDSTDLARNARSRINALNDALEDALTKGNRSLSKSELDDFGKEIMKSMNKGGITKESRKYVDDQIKTMKSTVKDVKGLHQFRKDLDDGINWNANPDSATAQMQAGAKELRSSIKAKLDNAVPGLKNTNTLYHDLTDIEKMALKSTNRVAGEATNAGSGIVGRLMTSSPVNTARAKSGRAMAQAGKYTAGTGGFGTQVTNQAMRQAPGNLLGAAMGASSEQAMLPDELAMNPPEGDMTAPLMGSEAAMFGGAEQAQPQSRYSMENALADIQRDPKNASKYMDLYEFVNAEDKTSAAAQQSSAKAQGAANIINELEGVFTSSGGARGPLQGRLTQAGAALGGGNQTAKSYQDLRSAYTAQISRALGEVGVLTDKDREVIQRAIPSINDSQQAAQIKIQTLRNILEEISGRGMGTQSNDLMSALSQYQGVQ